MTPSDDTARFVFAGPGESPRRGAPWRLRWYALWRLVEAVVILFALLTLVFYVVEVLPENPAAFVTPRGGRCLPEVCSHWGLDQPLGDRYVIFLTNFLTGNLGLSPSNPGFGTPIGGLIVSALPTTVALVGVTTVLLALLSLLIGTRLGRRKGGRLDSVASFLLALPFAVPGMMLGILAIYGLSVTLPVFPFPGSLRPAADPLANFANGLWYGVLPELVLLGASLGLFAWVVRDHPLRPEADLRPPPAGEWRRSEPTTAARVRGALPRFLAALPILFPWTLVGVMLSEVVFNINGVGLLFWVGVMNLNFFVMTSVLVVVSLLVLLPVLIVADVLHYGMTARWERSDGVRVEEFRVDPADPVRGLRKILRSALSLVGVVVILALVVMTAAAPWLVGPYPTLSILGPRNQPPSPQHALGTNAIGLDVLTLLVYGGGTAIGVAILAFALALIAELGVLLGIGFFGERAGAFLVFPVDLFLILSLPFAFLVVQIARSDAVLWGPALLGWPVAARWLLLETARIVPGPREPSRPKLSIGERGIRSLNLVWGSGPLLLADAFLGVSFSLLGWAVFGFVGLGPAVPQSWSQIVLDAFYSGAFLLGQWWTFVPAIVCILLAVLGPTLLGLRLKQIGLRPAMGAPPVTQAPEVVSVVPPGPSP